MDVNPQGLLGGDPVRPFDIARHVVQIVFALVRAVDERPQHALRKAAFQVQLHGHSLIAMYPHATACRLRGHACQAGHLKG